MASIGVRLPTTCPPYLYYREMTSVISGPVPGLGISGQIRKQKTARKGAASNAIILS